MRSYASVRRAWKWGSLPGGPALASRTGLVFSGSAAAILLLALAGCAPHLPEKSPVEPAASTQPSAMPSNGSKHGLHDRQTSATPAVIATLDTAVAAAKRFCRPELSKSRWFADLSPLLTLEAASVYATVNPARVQCSRVVLPARKDEGDGFTQVITVQTDRSPYRVVLSRSSLSDPWLVFRITPVGQK